MDEPGAGEHRPQAAVEESGLVAGAAEERLRRANDGSPAARADLEVARSALDEELAEDLDIAGALVGCAEKDGGRARTIIECQQRGVRIRAAGEEERAAV